MEVLNIHHILDQIILHLNTYDYLNLLKALKLEKEYTIRQLKLVRNNPSRYNPHTPWRLGNLLKVSLSYFTADEIRAYFNTIWEYMCLPIFSDKFFIENYDLIDHTKILELKYECGIMRHLKRDFSKSFHDRFPTFSSLRVCSNFGDCQTEIPIPFARRDDTIVPKPQLCSNCYINKCPRCENVMLPKLILKNDKYCNSCSPQYSDDDMI